MIIGSIGGMCRTGTGGSIPGWRESFVHGIAMGTVDISQQAVIGYSVTARIQNPAGEWLDIDEVTFFSMEADDEGNCTVSITVKDIVKWGNRGNVNPGILSPSSRTLQLIATLSTGSATTAVTVFTGYITSYMESLAVNNDAIMLTCKSLLDRVSVDQLGYVEHNDKSKYRIMIEQGLAYNIPSPFLLFYEDGIQPNGATYYDNYTKLLESLFTWTARIVSFQSGVIVQDKSDILQQPLSTISDQYAINSNRTITGGYFNTIVTRWHVTTPTDTWYSEEIFDAVDVAARGKIYAPYALTADKDDMSEAELEAFQARAEVAIQEELLGEANVQTRFNPLLVPSNIVTVIFTSERMNVSGYAVVRGVTHNYSPGNAFSAFSLALTPEA